MVKWNLQECGISVATYRGTYCGAWWWHSALTMEREQLQHCPGKSIPCHSAPQYQSDINLVIEGIQALILIPQIECCTPVADYSSAKKNFSTRYLSGYKPTCKQHMAKGHSFFQQNEEPSKYCWSIRVWTSHEKLTGWLLISIFMSRIHKAESGKLG